MTPTAIAAKLRQHSPGCLPKSVYIINNELWTACKHDGAVEICLHDDLAEAVLIAAMVMDERFSFTYCYGAGGWEVKREVDDWEGFADDDHGGPLGSCYKAWCWSRGINDA